jgi:uncharacterized OB-fold protein
VYNLSHSTEPKNSQPLQSALPSHTLVQRLSPHDWTLGGEVLHYQRCPECAHTWYFYRSFCPSCGFDHPEVHTSRARGVVYTHTTVYRAPDARFRELTPYKLVLVDLDEGFRMMAHGQKDLLIGEQVALSFKKIADQQIPYFEKI